MATPSGHHVVNKASWKGASQAAQNVWDKVTISNEFYNTHNPKTLNGVTHTRYNELVKLELQSWLKRNGKQLSKLTEDDALRFIAHIAHQDGDISKFLQGVTYESKLLEHAGKNKKLRNKIVSAISELSNAEKDINNTTKQLKKLEFLLEEAKKSGDKGLRRAANLSEKIEEATKALSRQMNTHKARQKALRKLSQGVRFPRAKTVTNNILKGVTKAARIAGPPAAVYSFLTDTTLAGDGEIDWEKFRMNAIKAQSEERIEAITYLKNLNDNDKILVFPYFGKQKTTVNSYIAYYRKSIPVNQHEQMRRRMSGDFLLPTYRLEPFSGSYISHSSISGSMLNPIAITKKQFLERYNQKLIVDENLNPVDITPITNSMARVHKVDINRQEPMLHLKASSYFSGLDLYPHTRSRYGYVPSFKTFNFESSFDTHYLEFHFQYKGKKYRLGE